MPYAAAIANPGTTTFELALDWGGIVCRDTVVMPPCGCEVPDVGFDTPFNCATGDANGVSLYLIDPNPAFTYTWSPADFLNTTTGTTVITTATNLISYTVTATQNDNPANTCSVIIDAGLPNSAVPGFDAVDANICEGDAVNIGSASTFGWSYNWESEPPGFTSTDSDPLVTPIETYTQYFVTVTDDITGCSMLDTAEVSLINTFAMPGEDMTICPGATVTLGEPSEPGVSYSWTSSPPGYTASTAQITVSPTSDIKYYLNVVDPSCSDLDSIQITINSNPTYTLSNDFSICEGSTSAYVSSTRYASNNYSWEVTNGTVDPSYNLNPPYRIRVYPDAGASLITVIGTTTFPGGCFEKDTTIINVNPLPTGTIDIVPVSCDQVQLTAIGGSFNANFWYINNIYQGNTNPIIVNFSGTVDIRARVRDATSNCYGNIETTYSNSLIAISDDSQEICPGNSATIGISNDPDYTYVWSSVPAGIYPMTSQIDVSPLENTSYTLTATRTSDACTTGGNFSIFLEEAHLLPESQAISVCPSSCATIGVDAEPNISYSWYPTTGISDPYSSTTQICPMASGSFTLTAQHDLTGCITQMPVLVNLTNTEGFMVDLIGNDICLPISNNTQLNATPSIDGSYSYNWSPAGSLDNPFIDSPIATPLVPTTYAVTVTDLNTNCYFTEEIEVDILEEDCIPYIPPPDTVYTVLMYENATDTCLTSSHLQILGNINTNTICNENDSEIDITINNGSPCVNIQAGSGFVGQNEACIITCDDSTPIVCDTTYFVTTVINYETTIICDENNSPNIASDDLYYIDLIVYSTVGTSWTSGLYSGAYNAITTLGPYVISNGDMTINITDVDDSNLSFSFTAEAPAPCSIEEFCTISDVSITVVCDDEGTPSRTNDDTFTFEITPMGSATSTWSGGGQSGNYGTTTTFGPYRIKFGDISFTIVDDNDPSCTYDILAVAPETCSDQINCNLTHMIISNVCDNLGTISDPSDDEFSFEIMPIFNKGTSWSGGGTSGNYRDIVLFGPYLLSDGNVTFDIIDDDNLSCITTVDIDPPNSCSNEMVCNLNSYSVNNVICDDNGTPSIPNDDTFSFNLLVDGEGLNGWSGGGATGDFGLSMLMGPFSIYNGNLNFDIIANCNGEQINVSVDAPAPCSNAPSCNYLMGTALVHNCCQDCDGNVNLMTAFDDHYDSNVTIDLVEFKPTNSSVPLAGSSSVFPIDGSVGSTFRSSNQSEPWWEIDLVGSFDLSQLIFNGISTSNHIVIVSETPFSSFDKISSMGEGTVYNTVTGLINTNIRGRFIRIYLDGTGQLNLNEVEILGTAHVDSSPYSYNWSLIGVGDIANPKCVDPGDCEVVVTDVVTGCSILVSLTIPE